jgi:hypothetical protein
MKQKRFLNFLMVAAIAIGLVAMPFVSSAKEAVQQWDLVNAEGTIKIEPMQVNAHPSTLEGKTVLLRSNGKHNADNYLARVGELLLKEVKDIKIIKSWEVAPETNTISQNPDKSKEFAKTFAALKPDLVIGSQCD